MHNMVCDFPRQWLAIQKLRSKIRKKVDRKASKGRKLRFHVLSKLLSFMAPIDHTTMNDDARWAAVLCMSKVASKGEPESDSHRQWLASQQGLSRAFTAMVTVKSNQNFHKFQHHLWWFVFLSISPPAWVICSSHSRGMHCVQCTVLSAALSAGSWHFH